jgi:plastocyanin
MRRDRRSTGLGIALAAGGALLAIWAGPVLAADQSVAIAGFAFSPSTVTVQTGDTVTWTNNDQISHNATSVDNAWASGTLTSGATGAVTFDTAGTFDYRCTIHPDMTGTVVVQAAGGTSAPTAPTTDTGASVSRDPDGPAAAVIVAGLAAVAACLALLSLRLRPGEGDEAD